MMNSSRKGQGLAEYALILALVSVSVIVVVTQLGGSVGNTFSNVMCVMDNTNNCGLDTSGNGGSSSYGNTGGGTSAGNTSGGGSSSGDTSGGGSSSGDTSGGGSSSGDTSGGGSSSGDTSGGGSSSGDTSGGGSSSGDTSGGGSSSGDTSGGGSSSGGITVGNGGGDSSGDTSGGGSSSGDTSGESGTSGGSSGGSDSTVGYQYFRLVAQSEVNGNPWTSVAELDLVDENRTTISKSGWSLQYVDSEETSGENGAATNAFDGNINTIWHTQWQGGSPAHNHEIQINLGQPYQLAQLRYVPRQSGQNGRVANYTAYVSVDASNWIQVANGTFPNSGSEQVVDLTGSSSQPDVCATATAPGNAVFQLENFTGSTVTDLSGNGNNASSSSGHYTMSNASSINTSTFTQKTLGVRFSTGSETSGRQIIFEQGGSTRGINVYIDGGQVYVGVWNRSTWGTRYINAPIATNSDYSVVLVFNNPNIQVYVNGNLAGSFNDAGDLTSHSGGIGVMGMNSNTYYHDGSGSGSADFSGTLTALLQWNSALSGNDLTTLQTYLDCS